MCIDKYEASAPWLEQLLLPPVLSATGMIPLIAQLHFVAATW